MLYKIVEAEAMIVNLFLEFILYIYFFDSKAFVLLNVEGNIHSGENIA